MSLINLSAGKLSGSWDYITNCSEIELFIQADCYYQTISMIRYYHQMQILYQKLEDEKMAFYFKKKLDDLLQYKNIKTETDYMEYKSTLEFCIFCLNRFGIKTIWNHDGHIEISQEFKEWHHKWQDYISKMDDDALALYRKCRYEGKGLEQFQLNKTVSIENVEDVLNSPKIKQYSYQKKENIRQKLA